MLWGHDVRHRSLQCQDFLSQLVLKGNSLFSSSRQSWTQTETSAENFGQQPDLYQVSFVPSPISVRSNKLKSIIEKSSSFVSILILYSLLDIRLFNHSHPPPELHQSKASPDSMTKISLFFGTAGRRRDPGSGFVSSPRQSNQQPPHTAVWRPAGTRNFLYQWVIDIKWNKTLTITPEFN